MFSVLNFIEMSNATGRIDLLYMIGLQDFLLITHAICFT